MSALPSVVKTVGSPSGVPAGPMDAQTRKAIYREKLREKEKKRIDSPFVSYNEYNQPVCRVCKLTLKSDSSWPAHQVSQKHQEALRNIKAAAGNAVKSPPVSEVNIKVRTTSSLPDNFFDQQAAKKQKTGLTAAKESGAVGVSSRVESVDSHVVGHASQIFNTANIGPESASLPKAEATGKENKELSQLSGPSEKVNALKAKPAKGVLPEGFYDNKDDDLRARGIEPVKIDIKDEVKEFEKAIQEDLQGVDDRLEEEEIDAAEMTEKAESYEQMAYWERVELLKKKQMELKDAKLANGQMKAPKFRGEESSGESSSDEGSDLETFTVDWRAKHL